MSDKNFKNILKKTLLSFLLAVFFIGAIFGGVFSVAKKANAQVGGVVADPGAVAQRESLFGREKVKETINEVLDRTVKIGLKNSFRYFVRKTATDLAKHLATKAAGRESLYYETGLQDYFLKVGEGALFTFLDTLSQMNGYVRFNYCEPDLAVRMVVNLAFINYTAKEPTCNFAKLKENWGQLVQSIDFPRDFQNYFNLAENDFSARLGIQTRMIEYLDEQEKRAILERLAQPQPIADLKDPLTQIIKTPGSTLSKRLDESTIYQPNKEALAWTGNTIADALGIFTNTFMSQWIALELQGLIAPSVPNQLTGPGAVPGSKEEIANEYYSSIANPQIRSANEIDIIGDFSSCPEERYRGTNNCVIDTGLAEAVRQEMTVREAMNAGLLHGAWYFGYKDALAGTEPDLNEGYAYSNMKKLRAARILPVGWELAAEIIADSGRARSLQDVVEAFDDRGEDGDCGTNDVGESEFCNMIDPNWVLKAPAQKCDRLAYGPATVSSEGGAREEICVDTKTCINENPDGSCRSWGYCTKEKNTWKFQGDDCPSYYNTCQTFVDEDNEELSFLENTIDKGICNASNKGCGWYCAAGEGGNDWTCSLDEDDALEDSNEKRYFISSVPACEQKDAGCSELINVSGVAGTNFVSNSSFEDFFGRPDEGNVAIYGDWGNEVITSFDSFSGIYSLLLDNNESTSINFSDLRTGIPYVASIWFKADPEVVVEFSLQGDVLAEDSSIVARGSEGWRRITTDPVVLLGAGNVSLSLEVGEGEVYFDAVQLEEGYSPTEYRDYGSRNASYIKKAPDYLNCEENSAACSGYAPYCDSSEVGCELYTPVNGDPAVPGIVRRDDFCPEECVGYDMFVQVATDFEDEDNPVYFIPDSANACTALAVGCEEFTNLENEQIEYFSEIRHCLKPADAEDISTFYTWEGSDQRGYRLQTWNLLAIANGAAPACAGENDCRGADICNQDIYESGENPDCRQFYSIDGEISYALYSRTITISEDCESLRQTQLVDRDLCLEKGGEWDPIFGACIYNAYRPESKVCTASQNGCREYKGNSAENVAVVLNDDFEDGTIMGWLGTRLDPSSDSVNVGGTSIFVPAASRASVEIGSNLQFDDISSAIAKNIDSVFRTNKSYKISFWAKGQGDMDVIIYDESELGSFGTVSLTPRWQKYELGPLIVNEENFKTYLVFDFAGTADMFLDNIILKETREDLFLIKDSWETPASCDADNQGNFLPQAQLGCEAYFDRDNNEYYLKSFDSLCRESSAGCEEFIDTKNSDSPYSEVYNAVCWRPGTDVSGEYVCGGKFGREMICTINPGDISCRYDLGSIASRDDNWTPGGDCILGSVCTDPDGCFCQGAVDCWVERGKTSCFANADESTVIIPKDSKVYLVEDSRYTCAASAKGCSSLGVPDINTNNEITGWSTAYLFDLPNNYANDLCEPMAVGCGEYQTDQGLVYFKDPGSKKCVYQESSLSGGAAPVPVSGWYKEGTNEPCYPDYFHNGFYDIWKNADIAYDGWVGICSPESSGCEEFVDPQDTSDLNPEGKPYYFIDNSSLDKTSCNGQVSLREGCVLFDQTSNPNKYYSSGASYELSEQNGYELVDPVTEDALVSFGTDLSIDSNLILKVKRDRECAEWLDCRVAERISDPLEQNQERNICYDVGLCIKFREGSGECQEFATERCREDSDCNIEGQTCTVGYCASPLLSEELYKERDLSWSTQREYTGYSIPGMPDLNTFNQVRSNDLVCLAGDSDMIGELVESESECSDSSFTNTSAEPAYYLTPFIGDLTICTPGTVEGDDYCSSSFGENSVCLDVLGGAPGRCVIVKNCRAYPRSDAPFAKNSGISGTNECIDSSKVGIEKYGGCDCSYQEITAGGERFYFNAEDPATPRYICSRDDKYGQSCSPAEREGDVYVGDCVSNDGNQDLCRNVSASTVYQGWRGYCLEEDSANRLPGNSDAHQCLQWYPIDILQGEKNLFDYNTNAVYSQGPSYYCVGTTGEFSWYYNQDPENISPQCSNKADLAASCPSTKEKYCEQVCANSSGFKDDLVKKCAAIAAAAGGGIGGWVGGVIGGVIGAVSCELGSSCEDLCSIEEAVNDLIGDVDDLCSDGSSIFVGDIPKDDDKIFRADAEGSNGSIIRMPPSILGYYHFKAFTTFKYDLLPDAPIIYEDQIESIEFQVESTRKGQTDNLNFDLCYELDECMDLEGGDDCMDLNSKLSEQDAIIMSGGRQTYTLTKDNSWYDKGESDEGSLELQARFSFQNSRLEGIDVIGFDKGSTEEDHSGVFIVTGYQITFKPGCDRIANIKRGEEVYAYTNTINDLSKTIDVGSGMSDKIDRNSFIQPWGATLGSRPNIDFENANLSNYTPLDTYIIGKTDKPVAYAGSTYSFNELTDNLFGFLWEVWDLDYETLEYNKYIESRCVGGPRDGERCTYETLFCVGGECEEYVYPRMPEGGFSEKVQAPAIEGISINGKTGEDVFSRLPIFRASLGFYMYDPTGESMPIREVEIDWGDGTAQKVNSAFGNYMPSGECGGSDWSRQPERCEENKLEFVKVYNECLPGSPGYVEGNPLCLELSGLNLPGVNYSTQNCCVYYPTIRACNNFKIRETPFYTDNDQICSEVELDRAIVIPTKQ